MNSPSRGEGETLVEISRIARSPSACRVQRFGELAATRAAVEVIGRRDLHQIENRWREIDQIAVLQFARANAWARHREKAKLVMVTRPAEGGRTDAPVKRMIDHIG